MPHLLLPLSSAVRSQQLTASLCVKGRTHYSAPHKAFHLTRAEAADGNITRAGATSAKSTADSRLLYPEGQTFEGIFLEKCYLCHFSRVAK
jgi:hypothetical protein